jgi:hypothetical protein
MIMKTCEYLMPDDYECNDVAPIKVGKKWYCQDHAHEVETGEAVLPLGALDEEEDTYEE